MIKNIGLENDIGFLRRISFLILKTEKTYAEIYRFINQNLICPISVHKEIDVKYKNFKQKLDSVWSKIEQIKSNDATEVLAKYFSLERPDADQGEKFLTPLIGGLALGSLLGAGLFSLFKKDNSEEIKEINNKIHNVNKDILITNKRIDVLSKNLTTNFNKIKIILENMHKLNRKVESKTSIIWNLGELKQAAVSLLILFKIADNSLTLLRSGHLNGDLLSLETFREVLTEGKKHYKNLEFPIDNIHKNNTSEIISLLSIKHFGGNKFVMVIPLVNKDKYKIYSLIPHPIKLNSGTLMIAELSTIILTNNHSYVIVDPNDIKTLNDNRYMIPEIYPIYSLKHHSCEIESLKQNTTAILTLCNFRKLGSSEKVYLTDTPHHRLVYLADRTPIELNCPSEKLRDTREGLHIIPIECDFKSNSVFWPARLEKEINIKNLLAKSKKGKSFEITNLPFIEINESMSTLHNTIKSQIDNLTSEPFTFDFDNLSVKQVQSISIVAYGTLAIFVIINSILIGLLYLNKIKKCLGLKYGRDDIEMDLRESFRRSRDKLRRSRNQFKDALRSSKDSLTLHNLDRFRRARERARSLSERSLDSVRSSIRSAVAKRRNVKSRREPPKISTLVNVATNTENKDINPSETSFSDTSSKENSNRALFKAY